MYSPAELESLLSRLNARQLPATEWTHRALLAAAVWHLWQFPPDDSLYLLRGRILRNQEQAGIAPDSPQAYHETLTYFWLRAVRNFIKEHHYNNTHEVLQGLEGTELDNSDYPLQFFSKALLATPASRTEWVNPDLQQPHWL